MDTEPNSKQIKDYSLLNPETSSDPYEFFSRLHTEQPVYQMPETGAFVVTKYNDLRTVLKDTETFSNDLVISSMLSGANPLQDILKESGWEHVQTLQRTDPPVHGRYRKLLDRVFTIKRVREMMPYIQEVTDELIDQWIDQGECEFNNDFAMPMPGIIIAEQLGLGRDEVKRFKRWADAMLGGSTRTEEQVVENANIELEAQHYLAEVFEQRKKSPQDDIMSGLVHAHGDDEEPLTMHELQNLMHQLITGGFETTQSALNHGMWTLVRKPELVAQLRGNAALMKTFVDEVLRWESPVQFLARQTTCDTELGGTTIPKGSMVMVGYGAANRDPEKFECPHQFDLDRKNAGSHLAFGSGAHFCVGAILARQEMTTAFTQLIERLDNIRLKHPLPEPVHNFSMFFIPMAELPIKFDKRR
ncbi:MAG: cytochrome P450 [Pseudomonadota bacterium]